MFSGEITERKEARRQMRKLWHWCSNVGRQIPVGAVTSPAVWHCEDLLLHTEQP